MGLFNRWFKKEPEFPPIELSLVGADMHSHFIPNIDDGSSGMEESLDMLKAFQDMGYRKVITTPHVMSDYYKNTSEIILGGLAKVRKEMKDQGLTIELEASAEYYLDEQFILKIKSGELLPFGANYILFELPFMAAPANLDEAVFELQMAGYKPILAHPERYGYWHNDFQQLRDLREKNVFLQMNILSLIPHYGPEIQKIARKMVDEGLVDFLGTDCHNMRHIEAIEFARKDPYLHKLVEARTLRNYSLLK